MLLVEVNKDSDSSCPMRIGESCGRACGGAVSDRAVESGWTDFSYQQQHLEEEEEENGKKAEKEEQEEEEMRKRKITCASDHRGFRVLAVPNTGGSNEVFEIIS